MTTPPGMRVSRPVAALIHAHGVERAAELMWSRATKARKKGKRNLALAYWQAHQQLAAVLRAQRAHEEEGKL